MLRNQEPPARLSPAMTKKKAAHPQTPYARQMAPGTIATAPPTIRAAPKHPRGRYSHGLMMRCRPDRGGYRHHWRKVLGPELSSCAFMGVASWAGCCLSINVISQ